MNWKYALYSGLSSAGTALAGFLIYKWRTRVELDAKKESAELDVHTRKENWELQAQQEPMKILRDELSKRESELAEMRAQDRSERATYIETLTAMKKALEEIATDVRAHREEERERAKGFHSRLDVVDDRLLVIETQLGKKGGS